MKEAKSPKSKTKSKQIPTENMESIVNSLHEIVQTLAFVSYQSTEDSGDYNQPGNGGRRGIYKTYWENEYQFIFFSAFYTLKEELQKNLLLRKTAKDASKLYHKFLADKKACDQAYREHKGPSSKIDAIRIFNGTRLQRPDPMTMAQILPRMKSDKFLLGWKNGLPPHLSHIGDRPVIKK